MNTKELIQQVLYIFVIAILPLLTKYIVTYLNVKVKENINKIDNDKLEQYVEAAIDAISMAVLTVNQTYVDELKRAGKFTKEAQETAKKMAIAKAKKLITNNSKVAIETLYNDFNEYISNSIEAMVRENKIETNEVKAAK